MSTLPLPRPSRPSRTAVAVTVLPPAAAAAAVLLGYARLRPQLPEPLAVHFSAGGADGTLPAWRFLAAALGMIALTGDSLARLALADGMPSRARRALTAGDWAAAALLGSLCCLVPVANAHAARAADAHLSGLAVAACGGGAALAAAVGLLLSGAVLPPAPSGPTAPPAPVPIELAAGEVVSWSRTVGSPLLRTLGPALLGLAAVLLVSGAGAGALPAALIGAISTATGRVRVTVDRHGLTVRLPLVRRPWMRVPLERIAAADRREVRWTGVFGDEGYRSGPGRSGLVLRPGGAVAVLLTDGREFLVSVPDAATAAGLLTALVRCPREDRPCSSA
ncbi:hypothetical protein [Kitasatospora sp. DSM 101779]|uniref:hypothetical protein n=1 Tax=Kitasatospora sp. DSM 101779 TaxID=2853165 RepID=UPI0021DABAA0|nr:hypothetical protein [Kitasatospora sp. DSM 101779]MCU7825558.1 hypothetical protein [Kitasatospora sp. DSM 101779]